MPIDRETRDKLTGIDPKDWETVIDELMRDFPEHPPASLPDTDWRLIADDTLGRRYLGFWITVRRQRIPIGHRRFRDDWFASFEGEPLYNYLDGGYRTQVFDSEWMAKGAAAHAAECANRQRETVEE